MAKLITCISRNAQKYCQEISQIDPTTRGYFWSEHQDCERLLCIEILDDSEIWKSSEGSPVFVSKQYLWSLDPRDSSFIRYWIFKNRIFEENHSDDYSMEERKLLVMEEFDRERLQFEKLHAKFFKTEISKANRVKIPSEIRIFVWQRDGGRCVECGTNENLEYDHIIPFAKGGSSTERNLQLLCANCNRLKSDRIQ
jgi:hypothetical protein